MLNSHVSIALGTIALTKRTQAQRDQCREHKQQQNVEGEDFHLLVMPASKPSEARTSVEDGRPRGTNERSDGGLLDRDRRALERRLEWLHAANAENGTPPQRAPVPPIEKAF